MYMMQSTTLPLFNSWLRHWQLLRSNCSLLEFLCGNPKLLQNILPIINIIMFDVRADNGLHMKNHLKF